MKKAIKLISVILVGASLVGASLPNNIASAAEIVERVNIKIQGGLESVVKSGDYPKYKNSSYVAVSVYYTNSISGEDIAALHRCKAQIPFGGINNRDLIIDAGIPPSMQVIEQCANNQNILFIMPNYPQ